MHVNQRIEHGLRPRGRKALLHAIRSLIGLPVLDTGERMTNGTQPDACLADSTRAERLRRWVILLGILFIVANVATDAYDQWRAYRFAVDDTSRELVNTARILAGQTEGTLKSVDVLLRDVADGYLHTDPTARIRDIDAALAGRVEGVPQLLLLKIADADGVVRYRSRPFVEESPAN